MKIRFGQESGGIQDQYGGENSPFMHIEIRVATWKEKNIPEEEWVHQVRHRLDIVPTNWYVQQELRHATVE